jgi:hypothetical protein
MNIYVLKGDLDYISMYMPDNGALDQIHSLWMHPGPIAPLWQPISIPICVDRDMPDYVLTDIATASPYTVFSPRAVETLRPIFGDHAEFLPGTAEGNPYFLIRVMTRLNGVIEGSDENTPAPESSEPWPAYHFKPERVDSLPPIFKIPNCSYEFITEGTAEAIDRADLSGSRKILAWSPETGGVKVMPWTVFYHDLKAKRKEEKAKRAALREKLGLPPWKPQPRKKKEA